MKRYRESQHGEVPRHTVWGWLREYVLNWYAIAWVAFVGLIVYVWVGIAS